MASTETKDNGKQEPSVSREVVDAINAALELGSKKLDLSKKSIEKIPDELTHFMKLEFLYLEGNSLKSLPDGLFSNFPNLKWLDLRNNNLSKLPASIGELRSLRSLLLENNNLKDLPLELGFAKSLSGLHLAGNPLEYPPTNITEQGTQTIIAFLRDEWLRKNQICDDVDLSEMRDALQTVTPNHPSSRTTSDRRVKSSTQGKRDQANDFGPSKPRRFSLEEGKSPFNVRSSIFSDPSEAKKKTEWSAIEKTQGAGWNSRRSSNSGISVDSGKERRKKAGQNTLTHNMKRMSAGLLKKDTVEGKIQEEMRKAEEKIKNAKIDAVIQQRKNKLEMEEWRKETKKLQRDKNRAAVRQGLKYEHAPPPFGTADQEFQAATKHGQQVSDALQNLSKASLFKANRDRELFDRIGDHVRKIEMNRAANDKLTPAEEVELARRNLDRALKLRDELEEKKALEYRLRAFTAEDFAPPSHALGRK